MTRVKSIRSATKKHKKTLSLVKGFIGAQSKLYRIANQKKLKSLYFSYIGRKLKKRIYRKQWIIRIKNFLQSVPSFHLFAKHYKHDGFYLSLRDGVTNHYVGLKKAKQRSKEVIEHSVKNKTNYSSFMYYLKKNNIQLNRKIISQLILFDYFSIKGYINVSLCKQL